MDSEAIDPVDFREAQHRHWDAAAVGWMQCSAFDDRADRHIGERLVALAAVRSPSRIRRFLDPGARIAISSWGEPDEVPFLSIPMRATMERLDVPPPAAGTPGPLSRPTPAAIGGLLAEGGSRTSPWSRTRSPTSSTPRRTSPPTSGRSPPRSGR